MTIQRVKAIVPPSILSPFLSMYPPSRSTRWERAPDVLKRRLHQQLPSNHHALNLTRPFADEHERRAVASIFAHLAQLLYRPDQVSRLRVKSNENVTEDQFLLSVRVFSNAGWAGSGRPGPAAPCPPSPASRCAQGASGVTVPEGG